MSEFANTYSVFVWVDGEGLCDVGVGYTQNVEAAAPRGRRRGKFSDSLLTPLDLGAVITHEAAAHYVEGEERHLGPHPRVQPPRVKGGRR